MRKFLARLALVLAFLTPAALIAPVGHAVTLQQDLILFGSGLKPKFYANLKGGQLPGWLTYTASTNMTFWDSAGTLRFAPNNALANSNDFTTYTKLNGGTGSVPVVTASAGTDPYGGNNASRVQFSASSPSGTNYSVLLKQATLLTGSGAVRSLWIKSNTGASQNVAMYDANGGLTRVATATTSWQRFDLAGAVAAGAGQILFGCQTGSDAALDLLVYNGVIATVTSDTTLPAGSDVVTGGSAYYGPFVDYDPLTLAALGIRKEPAATNIVTYSSDYSQAAWTKTDVTLSAGTTGPVGASTGTLVTEGVAGTASLFWGASAASASVPVSFSWFFKYSANASWVRIICADTASTNGMEVWANIQTGTLGTAQTRGTGTGASAKIKSVGNGWYQITGSVTFPAGATTAAISVRSATADLSSTRVNNAAYYAWQADFVLSSSFATSPIPTYGAAANRAENYWTFNGAALTALTGAQASIALTGKANGVGTNVRWFEINDNSPSNTIAGFQSSTIYGAVSYHSGTSATSVNSADPTTAFRRLVAGWVQANNSLTGAYDGGAVFTGSGTVLGASLTNGLLGGSASANRAWSGWFSEIGIWNTNIPDAKKTLFSTAGARWQ